MIKNMQMYIMYSDLGYNLRCLTVNLNFTSLFIHISYSSLYRSTYTFKAEFPFIYIVLFVAIWDTGSVKEVSSEIQVVLKLYFSRYFPSWNGKIQVCSTWGVEGAYLHRWRYITWPKLLQRCLAGQIVPHASIKLTLAPLAFIINSKTSFTVYKLIVGLKRGNKGDF